MMSLRERLDPGHTMDFGVTVDQAVSFIVDNIKDPLNPRWCGPSLMTCMIMIQFYHNNGDTLIKSNHAFGSAIVAFLTAKRSTTDMERLDSHGTKCRCSPADICRNNVVARLHYLANGFAPVIAEVISDRTEDKEAVGRFGDRLDTLSMIVDHLVRFLKERLSNVKPLSVARGRHPAIWPATPKDLIPYGPETTVESLVSWARFMRSAHVFALVNAFMHTCGPLIVPAIVSSNSAAKYMVEHGLQICADVSSAPLTRDGRLTETATRKFCQELTYLESFISGLGTLPPLLNRDFHFGHAADSFEFASKAISIMESLIVPQFPDSKRTLKEFTNYAAVLYTLMLEQMTVPKARVHPSIISVIDHMFTPSPPAVLAWQMIRHARSIQFCFAPGCPESAQSSGEVYQRCGGCRVVAYSSKACQDRAWKDERLPHKTICKKMRQILDAGGVHLRRDEDQDKFVQDMKRANIEDSTLQEVGMWLCLVYMMLQREGPLLTEGVREYLKGKEGPIIPEGMHEHYLSTHMGRLLLGNDGPASTTNE